VFLRKVTLEVSCMPWYRVCTRPSISHVVENYRSYIMSKREKEHWTTIKRVFKIFMPQQIMQSTIKEGIH
jgi:hypothetical protein